MKLLSVNNARSIWLGHLSDLNPCGINLFPAIVPLLVDTYKFIKYPTLQDSSNPKDGLKFEQGSFEESQGFPLSINLTIYNDGIIADSCASTDHTDSFLKDMLTRFDEIFKMSKYEEIINVKKYLSELFVTTSKSLELVNPQLKLISEFLSANVEQDQHFEVGGISFFPDQTIKNNPPAFRFERAVNALFSENRYYSLAALQTCKHIELLDKLEAILAK